MKIVRGRGDARWLPSRHRFALFRLFAWARLSNAQPEPRPGLMLMVDRGQSALETFTASTWITLHAIAYVAFELAQRWPAALAILAAIPLGIVAIQAPIYIMGTIILPLARVGAGHAKINSVVTFVIHLLAASYYATSRAWIRFVAWQFLALLVLNAIAATIVFLCRGRIARLESTYGATPSSAS